MLIAPIFIILSSSTSVFLVSHISGANNNSLFSFVAPWVRLIAEIFPYIIVWLLFTIIYMVMPNTKVNFKSAIIGGIIAGSMFQIFQNLYIYFQTHATRTSAIYGSFAALPLFLIWLQISWFVVLLGCEITFAVQSVRIKGSAERDKRLSISYLKTMAVFLMKILINSFSKGEKAPTSRQIAEEIKLPQHTVQIVLDRLVKAGAVSRVLVDKHEAIGYQPARNIDDFNIMNVIEIFENQGEYLSHIVEHEDFKNINAYISELNQHMKLSEKNKILKYL
jgi:membrane protein